MSSESYLGEVTGETSGGAVGAEFDVGFPLVPRRRNEGTFDGEVKRIGELSCGGGVCGIDDVELVGEGVSSVRGDGMSLELEAPSTSIVSRALPEPGVSDSDRDPVGKSSAHRGCGFFLNSLMKPSSSAMRTLRSAVSSFSTSRLSRRQ